jgi:hypothetical protein
VQLTRIVAARGVNTPNDVDRLDESQLAVLLENRTPSERIALKTKILAPEVIRAACPLPAGSDSGLVTSKPGQSG